MAVTLMMGKRTAERHIMVPVTLLHWPGVWWLQRSTLIQKDANIGLEADRMFNLSWTPSEHVTIVAIHDDR